MPRYVSVYLENWPMQRRAAASAEAAAADPASDLACARVLVAPGAGGLRITALNGAARHAGIAVGDRLASARAKAQTLDVADADPAADRSSLERLGLWCLRYTPLVALWDDANGADGLYLETGGSAHLFGGEDKLLADLAARLAQSRLARSRLAGSRLAGSRLAGSSLRARLAAAETPGAAWALARYGQQDRICLAKGREAEALAPLPLAALRLPGDMLALARRLGLRRIADILHAPRAPLAKRFGALLLLRLDQALGDAPEPLTPVVEPAVYHVQKSLMEPIFSEDHVLEAARRLLSDLCAALDRDGKGARRLRLLLFTPQGRTLTLDLGLAAPSRDETHIERLIALRLASLGNALGAEEMGYEAVGLHVLAAEPLAPVQDALQRALGSAANANLTQLVDRLEQRLGSGSVQRFAPQQSHKPERAVRFEPVAAGARAAPASAWDAPRGARPLLLFPQPEPAEVMALIPEGPPRQFRWRGLVHHVTGFAGPERIAPEWWRRDEKDGPRERDYYAVEDSEGRRFWLFRLGRYGEEGITPTWFLHGVFA